MTALGSLLIHNASSEASNWSLVAIMYTVISPSGCQAGAPALPVVTAMVASSTLYRLTMGRLDHVRHRSADRL